MTSQTAATAASMGILDEHANELHLRETLLTILASFSGIAAFAWGTILLYFDEPVPASLPYGYGLFSFATVALIRQGDHLTQLLRAQLVMILLVPFLLALTLGGFVGSGGVVIWSLLAPIGAFLIGGRRGALWWLGAYLAFVLTDALLDPLLRAENNLPIGVVLGFFVLNIGAVSAIAFGMLYYFVGENQRVLGLLQLEKDKSERLLLNVLPRDVAEVLRDGEETVAEQYESVSIIFADVVGFTPFASKMEPRRMVGLLNEVFSEFDSLAERHGVEKIHTIGDGYMAVAGAPRRRHDHAQAVARMALEMLAWLEGQRTTTHEQLEFRIGINSGPVVAGVIGTSKFQYDVWGDAVNLASRMESQGVPGRIQIGPATFELLRHEFECTSRGPIEVKGKGLIETWFLDRPLQEE
jgi:adenylate cyclase